MEESNALVWKGLQECLQQEVKQKSFGWLTGVITTEGVALLSFFRSTSSTVEKGDEIGTPFQLSIEKME